MEVDNWTTNYTVLTLKVEFVKSGSLITFEHFEQKFIKRGYHSFQFFRAHECHVPNTKSLQVIVNREFWVRNGKLLLLKINQFKPLWLLSLYLHFYWLNFCPFKKKHAYFSYIFYISQSSFVFVFCYHILWLLHLILFLLFFLPIFYTSPFPIFFSIFLNTSMAGPFSSFFPVFDLCLVASTFSDSLIFTDCLSLTFCWCFIPITCCQCPHKPISFNSIYFRFSIYIFMTLLQKA